ncbi:MAG: copper chaperone PCu(A)C [Chloroflexi bacterium]|nr:copper chaperone PCu(A)C [Chloroflexota bacterium]
MIGRVWFLWVVVGLWALAGCSASANSGASASAGPIQVSNAWMRPAVGMEEAQPDAMATPVGASAALMASAANDVAYMTLRNTGQTPDRLVGARSEAANAVELHIEEQKGDMMQMRPVDGIAVPAYGEVKLEPGGFHLMLIGLKRDLKVGDKVTIKIQFERAGEVEIQAEVRAQ